MATVTVNKNGLHFLNSMTGQSLMTKTASKLKYLYCNITDFRTVQLSRKSFLKLARSSIRKVVLV